MVNRATEQGQKILQALRAVDDPQHWLDRSEIARLLGKKRLTQYEIALLDLLTEQGSIETRQQEGYSPLGYKWQHRIKG